MFIWFLFFSKTDMYKKLFNYLRDNEIPYLIMRKGTVWDGLITLGDVDFGIFWGPLFETNILFNYFPI